MPRHTDKQIEGAAARFEQWAENVDPATIRWQEAPELLAVAQVADNVRADEARLRDAVTAARNAGRSWNRIAVALGVSRQAARQRFGDKPPRSHGAPSWANPVAERIVPAVGGEPDATESRNA
jgi:hypothetical protein